MRYFFLIIAALMITACATPMPRRGEGLVHAYNRGLTYKGGSHYLVRHRAPTPPSNAGFLYQPPIGWEKNNPRGFRLENKTNNLHGRCWLDGREVLPTAYGAIPRGQVVTKQGIKVVPLLPPRAMAYIVMNAGPHHIKCQLYAGPPPYQLVFEGVDPKLRVRGYSNGIYRLKPWYMTDVSGKLADN